MASNQGLVQHHKRSFIMVGQRSIVAIIAAAALPLLLAGNPYPTQNRNYGNQQQQQQQQAQQQAQQQQQRKMQQQQRPQPPASQPLDNAAQKEITAAREDLGKATKTYDDLIKSRTDDFEKSAEFTQTMQGVTDASAEF